MLRHRARLRSGITSLVLATATASCLVACSSKPTGGSLGSSSSSPTPSAVAVDSKERPHTPVVLAKLKHSPRNIAIDETSVYVTEVDFESQQDSPTNIVRIAKSGGPGTNLATHQMEADGLVVAGGAAYWIVAGDSDKNIADGVMAVPIKGGQAKRVGTAFLFADATALADSKYLYYGGVRDGASKLKRLPLAGGAEEEIASHGEGGKEAGIRTMALDQKKVYWLAGASIVSAPIEGGATASLVDNAGSTGVWGMARAPIRKKKRISGIDK